MRPLVAALALLAATQGGDFELRGVAAHARAADRRPRRRAAPARLRDRLPRPARAFRRSSFAARPARARHSTGRSACAATSRASSSPRCCSPCRCRAGERPIVVEVAGELISKPYVDITLRLLRALRRRRRSATAGSASRSRRAARYRSPGALHVEGDASSASYFLAAGRDRRARRAAAHRRRRQRLDPGRHRLRRRGARDGRDVDAEARAGSRCDAAAGRCGRSTLDCNHIPDAAMTLAALALFADGRRALDATSPAGASRRPTASPRWQPSCASSAPTVVEGADCLAVTPPARWRPAAIDTYDDHRMAMCLSLAAFNALAGGPRAGADQRPALRRQDLPRLLRDAVLGRHGRRRRDPGDHRRRPHRLGQGHAGQRGRRARSATHLLDSGAVYRATALAALRPASRPTTRPRLARSRARWTCASTAGEPGSPASTSPCAAPRGGRRAGLAHLGVARGAPGPARRCSWRSAACPAWSPTGATWAPSSSPTRRSRSSSPRAPRCAPSGGISN